MKLSKEIINKLIADEHKYLIEDVELIHPAHFVISLKPVRKQFPNRIGRIAIYYTEQEGIVVQSNRVLGADKRRYKSITKHINKYLAGRLGDYKQTYDTVKAKELADANNRKLFADKHKALLSKSDSLEVAVDYYNTCSFKVLYKGMSGDFNVDPVTEEVILKGPFSDAKDSFCPIDDLIEFENMVKAYNLIR